MFGYYTALQVCFSLECCVLLTFWSSQNVGSRLLWLYGEQFTAFLFGSMLNTARGTRFINSGTRILQVMCDQSALKRLLSVMRVVPVQHGEGVVTGAELPLGVDQIAAQVESSRGGAA